MISPRCEALARTAWVACALALPPLHANILGARPAPPAAPRLAAPARPRPPGLNPRPAPPPPATRVVARTDSDSGGRWLRVAFPTCTVLLDDERLEAWQRVPVGRHLPLEWTHRWTRGVRFGVGLAPAGLLPDLGAPAWRAYRQHLEQLLGPRLTVTTDDDSVANPDLARILGRRTRVLAFEFPGPDPDSPPIRVVEVAVEFDDATLLFRLDGPAANVGAELRAFERLVTRTEQE
jgi:hypothetical protein